MERHLASLASLNPDEDVVLAEVKRRALARRGVVVQPDPRVPDEPSEKVIAPLVLVGRGERAESRAGCAATRVRDDRLAFDVQVCLAAGRATEISREDVRRLSAIAGRFRRGRAAGAASTREAAPRNDEHGERRGDDEAEPSGSGHAVAIDEARPIIGDPGSSVELAIRLSRRRFSRALG